MLRNYFLCQELSQYCDVTLLTLQPKSAFKEGVNGYRWNSSIKLAAPDVVASKKGFFKKNIDAVRGRIYQGSFFEPANGLMLFAYPRLKGLSKSEHYDVVIFAHLSSLILEPLIRKLFPNAHKILDAHNVDHLLYKQENDLTIPWHKKEYERLRLAESTLSKQVDAFTACSENDKEILESLNSKKLRGHVIPNGADTYKNRYQESKDYTQKKILFCGSLDYEPNYDGLLWFYHHIWPLIQISVPDARLIVVGRNADPAKYHLLLQDAKVHFVGAVEDVRPYYYDSLVSIAPLRMGSGTRLKILESMSLGTSVVSTNIGAEGLALQDTIHIQLADKPEVFSKKVCLLLMDDVTNEKQRRSAYQHVCAAYSWKVAGHKLYECIKS